MFKFNPLSWLWGRKSNAETATDSSDSSTLASGVVKAVSEKSMGANLTQIPEDFAPVSDGENVRVEYNRGRAEANGRVNFAHSAPGFLHASVEESVLRAEREDVRAHFSGKAADVRFNGTNMFAPKGDVDFTVRGGASQWITGQTRQTINAAPRPVLLGIWRKYLQNPLVQMDTTAEQLDESFNDIKELRNFIATYLPPSGQRG